MRRTFYSLTASLLVFICGVSEAYKILVFSPSIGHSHVMFSGKIADTLVEAGHEVVRKI